MDVPLGETIESYLVRVVQDGEIKREVTVNQPAYVYPGGLQAADSVTEPFQIEVSQMSDRFGAGLFSRIEIND